MYANMMDTIGFVKAVDPEIGLTMERELERSRRHLELIASENVVSPAVLAAMGTIRQEEWHMTKKERALEAVARLKERYPGAVCSL